MHSREFKLEIARQIVDGQKRPAQACREYRLAESVLLHWHAENEDCRHWPISAKMTKKDSVI